MKKFVAIGHVDTGKSTLCGHLLYKTGFVNEHEMDLIREKAKKDKMEKWIWARILDFYEDEMKKGKTHEFNEIEFKYNDNSYVMIDTPGHKSFVRSMISGISRNIDIAVLMVSAIENEFISSFNKGMLKEHLILAKAVGINNLIVLINKMDTINWDKNIYTDRINEINSFLNYINWKDNVQFIPISSYTGVGIIDNDNYPNWYGGPNFVESLANIKLDLEESMEYSKVEKKQIIIRTTIINNYDKIISKGFKCIVHIDNKEQEITFLKIMNDKKFINSPTRCKCIIEFEHPQEVYENMRLILRKDDFTLGFGRVFKNSK